MTNLLLEEPFLSTRNVGEHTGGFSPGGKLSIKPALSNSSLCNWISFWSCTGMGQHFCRNGLPTHSGFNSMSITTKGHASEGLGSGPKISEYLQSSWKSLGFSRNFSTSFSNSPWRFSVSCGKKRDALFSSTCFCISRV